ncbi:MAG: hypothetical protein H0X61_05670 [Acidimicrobiia bacterium]|nr:hypothetical protein [Acidimicrobiia bacterium]
MEQLPYTRSTAKSSGTLNACSAAAAVPGELLSYKTSPIAVIAASRDSASVPQAVVTRAAPTSTAQADVRSRRGVEFMEV